MAKAIYASNKKNKKNSTTEWAESTKDGIAKGVRIYGDVRVSDEDTKDKKVFKNYANIARSFAEYEQMRNEEKERRGMQIAAEGLLQRYSLGKYKMLRPLEKNNQPKHQENTKSEFGLRKVGNQVVFASPSMPLPDPKKQDLSDRAQKPWKYNIAPEEYAKHMGAVDRYNEMTALPEADEETKAFLEKYFAGKVPTAEEFEQTYDRVMNDMSIPNEEVKYFFENGADLVGKAMPESMKDEEAFAQAQKAYEEARKMLGDDVASYATGREADYYERYTSPEGTVKFGQGPLDKYLGYGSQAGMTLEEARKYSASPYLEGGNGYDLQRWSQTTPEERANYEEIKEEYGEKAAEEYMASLAPELNRRLAGAVEADAKAYAEQDPFWSSAKTVLTSPIRGFGMMEQIADSLLGREVDPYDPRLNLTRESDTIRGTVGENLGEVGGFFYGTGMSLLDNLANQFLFGGLAKASGTFNGLGTAGKIAGGIAKNSTLFSMGLSSAESAYNDAIERGANEQQAMGIAVLSGVAESVFEKISLENFVELAKGGGAKNVVLNVLKQMGIEGSEEMATSIANLISDNLVMGELSNYNEAVNAYMEADMTEEEAKKAAALDAAKSIALDFAGGTLSGGVMGGIGEGFGVKNRAEERLKAAAYELAGLNAEEVTEQPVPEPKQEKEAQKEETPEDARTLIEKEYAQSNVPAAAQERQQQAENAEVKETEGQEENAKVSPQKPKNDEGFKQPKAATLETENGSKEVSVVGVDSVGANGRIMLEVEDESGKREVVNGADVTYSNAETEELMAYDAEKLDAKGLRFYLEDYDGSIADAEQYAYAFTGIYNRAKAGLDYAQAALTNQQARQYLTQDAMIDAFVAGQNAYNQTHDTVQPAQIETVQSNAPETAKMSAKEMAKHAKISRRYTQEAFGRLGDAGRKNAIAQMELLGAIASRTKRTIVIVDTIVGKDGKHANAMYDPKTGEIRVALDATESAYAYAAMHELTHAMKQEHASEWSDFAGFVKEALNDKKQNWDSLVQYQMDQFGYSQEQAEEEVVCNTVPALLQDERNVLKLYKGNRTLFDRVVDWVKGLLQDVKTAGEKLSKRSQSWSQMNALAKDRKTLQEMYDRMMAVMESESDNVPDTDVVKMSLKETDNMSWETQVHKVIEGTINRSAMLRVAKSSGILENVFGLNHFPIGCRISDLRKMNRKSKGARSAHSINEKTLKTFENELAEPSVAFENSASNKLYIVTEQKDDQGNPIVLVVEKDQEDGNGQKMHQLVSGYGMRNPVQYMLEHIKEGEKFYYKNEKTFIQNMSGAHYTMNTADVHEMNKRFKRMIPDANKNVNNKFSMQDSEGNTLTEEQQQYFADSKVKDENGNLMVMYHGTPSGNYEKFRRETYFTPMQWYADVYQNPSASSISYGKKNDAPVTYKAYLNITKPFDTRNARERQIFMNEYYHQWGTGAPLSESGLPDWTDGMDLKEFIDEMGYDYDGLILDEGGVPDENGGVKSRGLSYVIFEPSQAKLTENKTPTDDERFRYSLRDTDENVQSVLAEEEKALALVKGHRITAGEADRLAGMMLKTANSTYDRQQLAAEVSRTLSYAETGEDVDMRQIDDELTNIAARVMAKSRTLDMEHEEMAKPVRDYLRKTSIRLTSAQRAEAASMTGSYNAYRKAMFGRARLNSAAGSTLDSLWGELHDMAPQWFPTEAREGDMPKLLMEAVDAMKPVYHTGMGMNEEESANWLAGKVMSEYFALPAVKAEAANAKTFGDSIRALNAAMKRFEETSWTGYQNALLELKEARTKEERTQKQKEVAAMRAKYKKWRDQDTAQRKERELKNRYTGKIEQTSRVLLNWLDNPTDAKHIPDGLKDTISRMLASLDFSGKDTKVSKELSERLDRLADVMGEYQEGEGEGRSFFLDRDQQLIDEIKRVAELIRGNSSYQGQTEGRGVYELNSMELKELSKWLDVVRHNIMEASKLRGSNLEGYESVDQAAQMSMAEMSSKKPHKDKKWATKAWNEAFGADMQDSFTFFERLGTTTQDVFMGLRSGFDDMVQMTRQAEEHSKTILEGANLKEMTGKKAPTQRFQLVKGGTVEMTKANIMELYVLSKREQALGHMTGGGIRVIGDENARPHVLTKADIKAVTDTLTKDEKRIADGMQKFLSNECAAWGNATSKKLVGYEKFGEENYWPIKTDSNERNTTNLDNNYAADINAIRNQGMTKQTVKGASNAILIGDIFDTYTRHISNMAAYSAYSIPLSDFSRWYNTKGVKTEIEQLMGRKGLEYINTFLMAVNGTGLQEKQSGLSKMAGIMSRNAKIASVGANVRVVVQQPTSYARASMYMSPKYLSQALTMKRPDAELISKYCGIAQWKRWGFYETNIGPNLRQMIVGDQTKTDKLREAATAPAAWGDEWTINHLWNACELETKAETGYEVGSEAYYHEVGKRLSEIIDRTQVVDSVFHRSQIMRSKNAWNQMLTNFMSEPTKTYNMLTSAIAEYSENRKNKAAKRKVARAITVWAATGVMTAAAAAIVDAFRDDDAEKEWLEKYMDAFGTNALDNLNPVGMLPGVKDVLSLLQGYEPSRMDQQSLQKIMWAAQEIDKYVRGESKLNLYGVTYKCAQALSSVLGVPLSNVMRDMNAIVQTVTGVSPTLTADARRSQTITHLYKAMKEGDKQKAERLRAELRTEAGMSPKEIDTAIAGKLVEDPLIKQAWTSKAERRYGDLNRTKNALTGAGFGSETVDKAITAYGNSQKPKEEKAKDPNEELKVTLYTEDDVVSAMKVLSGIETGGPISRDDVKAMISERIAGSEAKEPEKTVKSGIQSEMKKEYLAMEEKGDTNGMTRLGQLMKDVLGTKEETMAEWVRDQHSAKLREAVDTNNAKAAQKAVEKMRKDGKTDSEIKSSLSKYKQIYIDAVKRGDKMTGNRIKSMLISLNLTGKNGKPLYSEETFEDWMK